MAAAAANDCYRPPVDAQLRYTVQWFHEWSEMQRGDFLPVLAQKLAPGSYINGLLSGVETLSCNEGRPPSLFQCRVKLFREWFETWSQAERDQLLGHIKSMDPSFYDKIQEELQALSGKATNGPTAARAQENGVDAPASPGGNREPSDEVSVAQEAVSEPVQELEPEAELEPEPKPELEAVEVDAVTSAAPVDVNAEDDASVSS